MNGNEVADLLELCDTYSPGFASEDRIRSLAAVWGMRLGDVDTTTAHAAVHAHYAREARWVTLADIRRHAATRHGLLPPGAEAAYEQAVAFNRWLGRRTGPEPAIHPAALEAARLIRWSTFDDLSGVAHRRFHDAYRLIAEKENERVLAGDLAELTAGATGPLALPGGAGIEETREGRARTPIDHAAAERLKDRIRKSGIGKLPKPPRPDYPAPTEAEKLQWTQAFREWAASRGHSIETAEEEGVS